MKYKYKHLFQVAVTAAFVLALAGCGFLGNTFAALDTSLSQFGNAMVYIGDGKHLMVKGTGSGPEGYASENTVFLFEEASSVWTRMAVSGEPPSPRRGFALVFVETENTVYLYGGDVDGEANFKQDLWKLDVSAMSWSRVSDGTEAEAFGPKTQSGMIWDEAGNRLILAGGYNPGGTNKVCSYNLETGIWKTLKNTNNTFIGDIVFIEAYDYGWLINSRDYYDLFPVPEEILVDKYTEIVTGLSTEDANFVDSMYTAGFPYTLNSAGSLIENKRRLWSILEPWFEYGNWERMPADTLFPQAESWYRIVYAKDVYGPYLFGGESTGGSQNILYKLDLGGWSIVETGGTLKPPARTSFAMSLSKDSGNILIHAGTAAHYSNDEMAETDDTWIYSIQNKMWNPVEYTYVHEED